MVSPITNSFLLLYLLVALYNGFPIGIVYWVCILMMRWWGYIYIYFHVISDQCNYPRSALIAVRGLALQGVAESPTIMLTHCPVHETHKHWLCLGRFNHSVFGYYWLCLFCATADCLLKYSSVIIVWGMCSLTMETTTSDRHLLISVIINTRLWRCAFDGSRRLIF